MRLENYYVVKRDIDEYGDEYDTLDFIKANVFDKQEILDKDYEYYSITHCWEEYDGTFEEEEIFLYQNDEVEIDDENLMAEEDLEDSKEEFANGTTLAQLKNMTKEELIDTIREIDTMWNYECGCNKQLVETQNKNERLKILLANALTTLEENGFGGQSFCKIELGITEEEYKEIMGENNE